MDEREVETLFRNACDVEHVRYRGVTRNITLDGMVFAFDYLDGQISFFVADEVIEDVFDLSILLRAQIELSLRQAKVLFPPDEGNGKHG